MKNKKTIYRITEAIDLETGCQKKDLTTFNRMQKNICMVEMIRGLKESADYQAIMHCCEIDKKYFLKDGTRILTSRVSSHTYDSEEDSYTIITQNTIYVLKPYVSRAPYESWRLK